MRTPAALAMTFLCMAIPRTIWDRFNGQHHGL
jgi:hypothetical protein